MSARSKLRGSLPYAIAVIGGFLVAYLIVAFLVFPSGVIPRDIKVPNVTGLPFDEAVRRLAERGLRGVKGEEQFHELSPKGTVLDQAPAPGAHDVEGASVSLAVSIGQQFAKVPALTGLTREDAQRALENAGFDVGDVTERPSESPTGQVIDSRPRAGSDAPIPGAVSLVVSAGPTVVLIPSVVGRSVADARAILEGAGLVVSDIRTLAGVAVTDENAIVSDQTPPAASQAAAGQRISLQVTPRPPQ